MALTPGRRYSADEKANILATIARAQQLCPERSLTAILVDLGLPLATYYRWQKRAQCQQLAELWRPDKGYLALTVDTFRPSPTQQSLMGVAHRTGFPALGVTFFVRYILEFAITGYGLTPLKLVTNSGGIR